LYEGEISAHHRPLTITLINKINKKQGNKCIPQTFDNKTLINKNKNKNKDHLKTNLFL